MNHKPTREAVEAIINIYNSIKDFACSCNVINNVYDFIEPTASSWDEIVD